MATEEEGLVPHRLRFLVAAEDEDEETMGIFRRGERGMTLREIPVAALRTNVRRVVAGLQEVFADAVAESGHLRLREMQVHFEVSASGGVHLIGTSDVSARGAITLVFVDRVE